ncbi:MAG: signal peptidase I [Hamadaea sp.]|uniref:signal peptidase I n=1 Tax=Hamadaea sp. TaxID=2024425 RepID=UPI0017C2D5DE|nr:signal peptidase I [Hamadaea sp.]NUT19820.1 signal peptidase I [Hamadaea sp.]
MTYTPTTATPRPPKRGLSTGAIVGIVAGAVTLFLLAAGILVAVTVLDTDTVRLKATGAGMEPTIRAGQTFSATKVDAGDYQPNRSDVVVFSTPKAWVAAGGDRSLVKRVIGLPGERVSCCDAKGQWLIDDKPLAEPYVQKPGGHTPTDVIVVPAGRLWVMGDNRGASNDSRSMYAITRDIELATIPLSAVTAVVKF